MQKEFLLDMPPSTMPLIGSGWVYLLRVTHLYAFCIYKNFEPGPLVRKATKKMSPGIENKKSVENISTLLYSSRAADLELT
jgi:hypothetical protein